MARTLQLTVKRWGNELALVIPGRVARDHGIGERDVVLVALSKGDGGSGTEP